MLILLPMHTPPVPPFKAERAQRRLPIRRLNISPETNCNALACVHVNINGNQMQSLRRIFSRRVSVSHPFWMPEWHFALLGIILIHTHTAGGRKRINFGFPSARTNQRPKASEWGAFATFALPPACSFYILFTFRPRPSRSSARLCVCALRIDRQ